MNMGKIIDSYINYLENYSSARSINDYYENNKALFVLEEPVVKGLLIKVPL